MSCQFINYCDRLADGNYCLSRYVVRRSNVLDIRHLEYVSDQITTYISLRNSVRFKKNSFVVFYRWKLYRRVFDLMRLVTIFTSNSAVGEVNDPFLLGLC